MNAEVVYIRGRVSADRKYRHAKNNNTAGPTIAMGGLSLMKTRTECMLIFWINKFDRRAGSIFTQRFPIEMSYEMSTVL